MLLVILSIMGMFISGNLRSAVEGKITNSLWGVGIDLLIKSSSELSFSGLAKHVNNYKLRSLKKGT